MPIACCDSVSVSVTVASGTRKLTTTKANGKIEVRRRRTDREENAENVDILADIALLPK